MKYLCLFLLMFISTSANPPKKSRIPIGELKVEFDLETNEFVVIYSGDYHRCFTKFIIDQIYDDCEELIDLNYLRERIQFTPKDSSKIDSVKPKKDPIKTIKM